MTESRMTTHTFSGLPAADLSRIVDLLVRNSCDHALVELDAAGNVLSVSESFYRIFGQTEKGVMGQPLTHFYPTGQQDPERMTNLISIALSEGVAVEEENYQRNGNQVFVAKTVLFPVSESDMPRFVAVVRDMTLLVASQEQLHTLVTVDEMTGLNNRQHLFDLGRIEYRRWERYGAPLSMILCDVEVSSLSEYDKNSALRDVSDVLRQCLREVDTPARVYEGIFCILMFSTPLEGASVVAERIRRAVRSTGLSSGGGTSAQHLKINLVVSTAGEMIPDFDAFYERAVDALQNLRRRGENHMIVL